MIQTATIPTAKRKAPPDLNPRFAARIDSIGEDLLEVVHAVTPHLKRGVQIIGELQDFIEFEIAKIEIAKAQAGGTLPPGVEASYRRFLMVRDKFPAEVALASVNELRSLYEETNIYRSDPLAGAYMPTQQDLEAEEAANREGRRRKRW